MGAWVAALLAKRPGGLGQALFVGGFALGLIVLTVLLNFLVTSGRADAAFRQPLLLARTLLLRDAAPYAPEKDGPGVPVISIQMDPQTGATQTETLEVQPGPAAPLDPGLVPASNIDSRRVSPTPGAR